MAVTVGVWSEMGTRDWKTWINDFARMDIVGCRPYWVVLTITRHIGGSYNEAFLHSSPYSTANNMEQYHFVSIEEFRCNHNKPSLQSAQNV